ncbi:MAG: BlaI/MecI/CopY family transcriptional regulator [Evtepia sp.]
MFTLSKNETEVVQLMWAENRPLSRTQIIDLSVNKSWKPSSIHILLNSLLKKEAIEVSGFVRTGKNYGRTYVATVTQDEYTAMQLTKNGNATHAENIPGIFAALIRTNEMDTETLDQLQSILDKRREALLK